MRESARHHTARFVCTTDTDGNQIASFYPGAMSEDGEIQLAPLAEQVGGLDLVLIGASDPAAMLSHTAECAAAGIPFAADPSQQLPRLDGPQVCALVDGAAYMFCNEYEEALIERKSGWSSGQVLDRVRVRVTTLGPDGARVEQAGQPPLLVGPVAEHAASRTRPAPGTRSGPGSWPPSAGACPWSGPRSSAICWPCTCWRRSGPGVRAQARP